MKQHPVITQFVMENYPGYLEFMADHFPIRNKTFSTDEQAEFLVAVLPEVKTVYDADAYAAVIKKHLPEKVEPEQLTAFARSFFEFHFERIRDRRNERLALIYKAAALLLLVQLAFFAIRSGIFIVVFYYLFAFLVFCLPVFTMTVALHRSKYEPLRMVDHIVFAANLLFNFIMLCWIIAFVG